MRQADIIEHKLHQTLIGNGRSSVVAHAFQLKGCPIQLLIQYVLYFNIYRACRTGILETYHIMQVFVGVSNQHGISFQTGNVIWIIRTDKHLAQRMCIVVRRIVAHRRRNRRKKFQILADIRRWRRKYIEIHNYRTCLQRRQVGKSKIQRIGRL